MKVVTWNCNGAFRNKFETISVFDADIYIIQECEDPEQCKDIQYKEWAKITCGLVIQKIRGWRCFARKILSYP